MAVDLGTTYDERRGLTPRDADSGDFKILTAPDNDDAGSLPVYLKPLEWLNAPLDLLPQSVRDALGQIAILTLINAVAVLIYVFIFRRQ